MNGRSHRALAAGVVAVALPVLPVSGPVEMAATAVLAVASSSGKLLSPDCDLGWLWNWIDWLLPDERVLGDNGPMQHRGITHFWLLPTIALLLAYLVPAVLTVGVNGHLSTVTATPALAGFGVGWAAHDLGDFLVGAEGQGRNAGIPLMPWWCWVGTGAKCGGLMESAVTVLAAPTAVWLLGAHFALWGYDPGGMVAGSVTSLRQWPP